MTSNPVPDLSDESVKEALLVASKNRDLFTAHLHALDQLDSERVRTKQSAEYLGELREAVHQFLASNELKPGDLVKWKQGLRNKLRPDDDEPCVVVEILSSPVLAENENPGSVYFREPLDTLIGVLNDEKILLIYHVDGRRLEKMT